MAAAVVIAAGATVEGSIGSSDDVDFFKVQLTGPGTVTFWTTGEADTAIALLDGKGNELAATGASSMPGASSGTPLSAAAAGAGATITASEGRVSVTTELDEVYARVTGRGEGSTGDYTLHNEFAENLAPRIVKRFTGVNVRAGAGTATVNLSEFFSDPEGGALTFSASLPAGSIGPVSLGLTVSGSVLSIISPANLRPGPVSITVTASDPLGLFTVQVLSVTVQPGTTTGGTGLDGCVTASRYQSPNLVTGGRDSGSSCIDISGGGMSYGVHYTNGCSFRVGIRYSIYGVWVSPPAKWSSSATTLAPGESVFEDAGCYEYSPPPRFRFCVHREDGDVPHGSPDLSGRCYGGNPRWQYP